MNRIKELKLKVKDGEATDEEKEELEVLEAKEDEETTEVEMTKQAEKLVKIIQDSMAKQAKDIIVEEKQDNKNDNIYKSMTAEQRNKEFLFAVINRDHAKLKAMTVGDDARGGFTVPTEWYEQIAAQVADESTIRPNATVFNNAPAQLNLNRVTHKPVAKFRAEMAIKDTSTVKFGQISLTPYSLAVIVVLSKELVRWSNAAEGIIPFVTRQMVEAIVEREEEAFAIGSGVEEPTGIDEYDAVTTSIDTTAAVVDSESIVEAFYALPKAYRRNASWLMNTVTLTKVKQLRDIEDRFMFIPDPTGEIAGTILGKPVLENSYLPNERIWFGDLSGYAIADAEGISIDRSEEATITGVGNLFERNAIAIRVEKATDGELYEPYKMVHIQDTN